MARSEIPVTEILRGGEDAELETPVVADATNDHYVAANVGDVFLEVTSTDLTSQTVEVVPNPTLEADGLTIGSLVIDVPAGGRVFAGPFRQATFKQDTAGMLYVNPSVSTTLEFRAYKLPRPTT